MARIHFLNVLEGDCNIIEHNSGRVSVIDVSNAANDNETLMEQRVRDSEERKKMRLRTNIPSGKVDYLQKHFPDNPIAYLQNLGITEIWRFIITHPDMDHLDGIRDLFDEFEIKNTWDTDNLKECNKEGFFAGYNPEDWEFYTKLRKGGVNTKRLALYAGQSNDFWNKDGLQILCPTKELLANANDCDDYNDSSYVLVYRHVKKGGGSWKFLFAGDSHDASWEHILKNYGENVSDVDVLFAPHHGRDSARSYEFLKTLNPTVTLFGNASSRHLAYSNYPEVRITNNQAGYVVMDITEEKVDFYIKNRAFANDFRNNPKRSHGDSWYCEKNNGYYLGSLYPE